MPLDLVIAGVAEALDGAGTVPEACQRAVDVLAAHTPAMIGVLLPVKEHLRCVAAAGSWQVYASIPLGAGVSGRVHRTGRTEVVTDVAADPDYISLGPDVAVEICARSGEPTAPTKSTSTAANRNFVQKRLQLLFSCKPSKY